MSNNRLYDTSKVKIIKIPAAMNYGMRKDVEVTASSKDGANRGQRTPYARTSKKKGGSMAKMNKGKQPKSYAQDTTPPSPYVATPDGYMVLKEKSVNIPIPKSKPKAQRKKVGGKIGSGCNRLY